MHGELEAMLTNDKKRNNELKKERENDGNSEASVASDQDSISFKSKLKSEYLRRLPLRVISGNSNLHFHFQRNYLLLTYYSLIQFRNY